jgi:hypothetical protein
MKQTHLILLSFICVFFLFATSCSESKIAYNMNGKLSFSTDTLSFDTVFTTIGSTTGSFMVYNHNSQPITIQSILLTNGATSGFHINVDGTNPTNNEVQNVEIRAHDSIYIFVAITVNPLLQNNPVLIEDSILFQTNNSRQTVKLQAYGQNVTIFRSKTIHNDTTLTNVKPYLIYNYLAIDSAKTLTLQPGTKLYFHQNASLLLKGNLIAEGGQSANQQIIMRGDRLDWLFPDVPYSYLSGQWDGLQFLGSQSSYLLNHVVITSGKVAINIPNGTTLNQPTVSIANSRIQNFDSCGITAVNANLNMYNTEISNCKSYCLLFLGGNYLLTHNTIANYYNDVYTGKQRDGNPSVVLLNKQQLNSPSTIFPLTFTANNCVIAGSMANELSLADTTQTNVFQFHFDHCYLTSPAIPSTSMTNIIWAKPQDDLFVSTTMNKSYYDFQPDSLSVLRGKANPIISHTPPYQYDMNGIDRFWNNLPDIGAYEWTPKNGIPNP